jgi:hypothetical protein
MPTDRFCLSLLRVDALSLGDLSGCRGQRSIFCNRCGGSGKWSIAGITIGKCKECDGTGGRRCDVCGGTGEIEADPSEPAGSLAGSVVVPSHKQSRYKQIFFALSMSLFSLKCRDE